MRSNGEKNRKKTIIESEKGGLHLPHFLLYQGFKASWTNAELEAFGFFYLKSYAFWYIF